MTHENAPESTESDAGPESGPVSDGEAQDAREARYAEAIPDRWVSNPGIREGIAVAVMAVADAEIARWKAKYREEWNRAESAREALAESTPVHRGWRGYADGSQSEVERWVRASNGDWVSLDSERRTDGDIILEHFSCAPDPEARVRELESDLAGAETRAEAAEAKRNEWFEMWKQANAWSWEERDLRVAAESALADEYPHRLPTDALRAALAAAGPAVPDGEGVIDIDMTGLNGDAL